ncbi:MAG: hypothetical protein OXN17_01435 [Candidatus Poribacteria bacterium]|nr:hypothetical protein [Candidatus Poribacteria bacterium]
MNRNRIITVGYFIVVGGMIAYKEFLGGDMYRAVLTAVSFTLFAILAFFYTDLQSWIKPFVVALPLIVVGTSIYRDFSKGDVSFAIVGVAVIAGGALIFFQSQPLAAIKAMFLMNVGGLFAYRHSIDGNIEDTVRMGILFSFFFVLFFYESVPASIRPFVLLLPINLLALSAYRDFRFGKISYAVLHIVLIAVGALMLVQEAPFAKGKLRSSFSLIPVIAFSVFLLWDLFLLS